MEVETLKELLVAFNGLSEDAKQAFLFYLLAEYGSRLLLCGSFICALFYLIAKGAGLLGRECDSEALAAAYGASYGSMSREELNDACRILIEARSKRNGVED